MERVIIPVKSFRLSEKKIESYNEVLTKLRIDGNNESEKFRNLIDFLNDYFELEPTSTPIIEDDPVDVPKLDVLELVLSALRTHEKKLNEIVERFEGRKTAYPPLGKR